jgi:hypothetical protein
LVRVHQHPHGARGRSAHHAPISQFWPSLVSYLTASA